MKTRLIVLMILSIAAFIIQGALGFADTSEVGKTFARFAGLFFPFLVMAFAIGVYPFKDTWRQTHRLIKLESLHDYLIEMHMANSQIQGTSAAALKEWFEDRIRFVADLIEETKESV